MTSHQVISWPHPVLWLTRFHRRPGFGNDLSCGIFNGNKLRWEPKTSSNCLITQKLATKQNWGRIKNTLSAYITVTILQHIASLSHILQHTYLQYWNILHIWKHLVEHDENLLVVLKLFIWYLHRILRKKRIITWESGTPSLTISGAPKYAYLMAIFGIFGRVFGHAKFGQVEYPWKILQNAVQTRCF